MTDYRIYLVEDDHIAQGYDFCFETHDQARAQAQSMLGTYSKAEVWIGTTRVGIEDLKTLPSSADVQHWSRDATVKPNRSFRSFPAQAGHMSQPNKLFGYFDSLEDPTALRAVTDEACPGQ